MSMYHGFVRWNEVVLSAGRSIIRLLVLKTCQKREQRGTIQARVEIGENSSRPAGAENKFRTDKVSKDSDREQTSLCSSSDTLVLLKTAVTGVSNGKDEACRGRYFLTSVRNNLTLRKSLQVGVGWRP